MSTKRQQARELLEERPRTVSDMCALLELRIKDAAEAMEHAGRSARPKRLRIVEAARCVACGFKFKDRTKPQAPSRCPRCKSEETTEPLLEIR